MKKLVASCLIFTFFINQSLISALAADISVGGPLPTDTSVLTNGNITNIQTNTTVGSGQIGINSFNRFNVNQGDIVNLNLINNQNKLVNLIFDSSASQINGVVNSYLNGQIGGNVLFANPNGFVIGEHGVFNVGSLTLMTPTENSMKELINSSILGGDYNETKIERLISFTFNDENYLVTGNEYEPYELASGKIEIAGKINSAGGIDLISGSEVNLLSTSELNANMSFSETNGNIVAYPSTKNQHNATTKFPTNLAMQNGENIVIVASNKGTSDDVLSAIVNLNGKVNANNGDVLIRTEAFKLDDSAQAISKIDVKSGSMIKGSNINLAATSKISDIKNGIKDDLKDNFIADAVSFLADQVVHISNVHTSVNIEKGAVIEAINNVILKSISDLEISSGATIAGSLPDFNLNVTTLGIDTSTLVRNGSSISAKNLVVDATTDLNLATTTKSTNIVDQLTGKQLGSYAVGVTVTNIENKAEIEKNVALSIADNIDILAKATSFHKDTVKNGFLPVIDKNHGPVGIAVSVIVANIVNEAIMNANASINGKLNIEADYKGNIVSSVYGYSGTGSDISGGSGPDGFLDNLWKHTKSLDEIKDVVTRANAKYNDIDIAGAIGVFVDNVTSVARIGNRNDSDAGQDIKPQISAAQIQVNATATDYKSNVYVQAESEQGATTAGGAIAVNYKDLNSLANAYGTFTLSGSNENVIYTPSINNAVKNDGNFYKKDKDDILLTKEQYEKLDNEDKEKYNVLESTIDVYWYMDNTNTVVYTDNVSKKIDFVKADGIFYTNNTSYISQAEYNRLSNEEKESYTLFEKPVYSYLLNGESPHALTIKSNTEIVHPMAWIDWFKTLLPFFDGDNYKQAWSDVKNHWNSVETNDVTDYLSYLSSIGELGNVMDEGGFDIFNAIDFNNLGAYGFFNTFAQSKANAQTQQGDTKAFSGALAIALFNASAAAVLDDNSLVHIQATDPQKAGINVSSFSNNEVWTASTLMDLMNFSNFFSGATARDGSAYGIGAAFTYSDSNVISKIGDNVKILKDENITDSKVGDVSVTV